LDTFENFHVDFVYFYNMDGELIRGEIYETKEGSVEIITSAKHIKQSYALLKPYIDRAQHSRLEYSRGLIVQENMPVMFSIRPILTSEDKGPSTGYSIMGKLVNDKALRQYQKLIKIDFSTEVIDPEAVQTDLSRSEYNIIQLDDSYLSISKYYYSNGIPVLNLSTNFPRDITLNGIASINYAL
jgi:sensor domain CHASE-containing protein